MRAAPSWQKDGAIFGLFLLLSLAFTNPLLAHLASALHDPVDPLLNTWIVAWGQHVLLSQPGHLLDANIFYPYQDALLYSETLIIPAMLLLPIRLVGAYPVLIYNLMVLAGLTLTGFSGYLLGRQLIRNRGAGIAVGLILAFNPYTLSVLPKAQLLQLYWLPLALLYVHKLLRKPRAVYGLAVAGYLAAQFYTVIYYGFFAFISVGLCGAVGWLLRKKRHPNSLRILAAGLILGIMLCLPLALPYLRLSQSQGLVRTLTDAWPFSASLEMWYSPPPGSLASHWLPAPPLPKVGYYPVEALFPGLVLLTLAAGGFIWRLGRPGKRWAIVLTLGVGLFFVLSLGPYLQIHSLQPDFQRILPYATLHNLIPGFTALRAPARFAALVFLGLGLLAGGAISRLRPRWQAVSIALLFLENLAVPASSLYMVSNATRLSPVYSWLAKQPPAVILELPAYSPQLDDHADQWLAAQYGSTYHWQTTPAGYSGFVPQRHVDLLLLLNRFPQPEALALLSALDVRYVILHTDQLSADVRADIGPSLDRLRLVPTRYDSDWIITLPPAESSPTLPTPRYLISPTARPGESMTIDVVFVAETPLVFPPDTQAGKLIVEWRKATAPGDARPEIRTQVGFQPPFYVDGLGLAPVRIPTPSQAGAYRLTLRPVQGGDGVSVLVTLAVDSVPPEVRPVPVRLRSVASRCEAPWRLLALTMQTIGWYDEPFRLSARLLDSAGHSIAQSDVEFPPYRPRANLLAAFEYDLPFDTPIPAGAYTVEIFAYQWQQEAERIVPRYFLTDTGEPADRLRLTVSIPDCP